VFVSRLATVHPRLSTQVPGRLRGHYLKDAQQVGSASLRNPHDPEATYSGQKGKGYELQVAEPCQLGLGRQGLRDPQGQAVPPLLHLGAHRPSPSVSTMKIHWPTRDRSRALVWVRACEASGRKA
jgi:hypothetical protein